MNEGELCVYVGSNYVNASKFAYVRTNYNLWIRKIC